MFNRERTKIVFGYDLDLSKKRRTKKEIEESGSARIRNLKVVDNCPECNSERQITLHASRKNKQCSKCHHNSPKMIKAKQNQSKIVSEETKQRMKDNHWSKSGTTPWNKDKTGIYSEETLDKIREATKQQNKDLKKRIGVEEYSILMSCWAQGIKREDFTGFTTPENTKIRQSKESKDWKQAVLKRDNFTCTISGNTEDLQIHHLSSFASNPKERFKIDNGITLNKEVHSQFHSMYGKKNNTKEQFEEFKKLKLIPKESLPTVYIVSGIAGSGKSWACEQLTDKFNYVSYDSNRKKTHLDLLRATPTDKIALYDLNIKTSTFIRRHSHEFNIHFVTILGDFLQVKQQLKNRGGKITKGTYKRWKVMKKRAKQYGEFAGSSQEVLKYLKNL